MTAQDNTQAMNTTTFPLLVAAIESYRAGDVQDAFKKLVRDGADRDFGYGDGPRRIADPQQLRDLGFDSEDAYTHFRKKIAAIGMNLRFREAEREFDKGNYAHAFEIMEKEDHDGRIRVAGSVAPLPEQYHAQLFENTRFSSYEDMRLFKRECKEHADSSVDKAMKEIAYSNLTAAYRILLEADISNWDTPERKTEDFAPGLGRARILKTSISRYASAMNLSYDTVYRGLQTAFVSYTNDEMTKRFLDAEPEELAPLYSQAYIAGITLPNVRQCMKDFNLSSLNDIPTSVLATLDKEIPMGFKNYVTGLEILNDMKAARGPVQKSMLWGASYDYTEGKLPDQHVPTLSDLKKIKDLATSLGEDSLFHCAKDLPLGDTKSEKAAIHLLFSRYAKILMERNDKEYPANKVLNDYYAAGFSWGPS